MTGGRVLPISLGVYEREISSASLELSVEKDVPHIQHNAFCLETQHFPNSINESTFPSVILKPGETFNYSGNEKLMEKEVKKFSDKDFEGYNNLVNFTEKIFDKGFTDLSDRPFNNLVFMMKQIPSLLKLKSYKSVYSLVSNYITDEKLRRVFSMHPLLVGGNPFSTTSIYTLILFLEKKWGIHYSMGGTGSVVNALEKLMMEENIKIIKNAEVTEILVEKIVTISFVLVSPSQVIALNVVEIFFFNNLFKISFDNFASVKI